jgi:hypothetical protein
VAAGAPAAAGAVGVGVGVALEHAASVKASQMTNKIRNRRIGLIGFSFPEGHGAGRR